MANKKNQEPTHDEVVVEAVNKTEEFFQKNQKIITWACVAIVVIIGGYFANKYLIAQPRAEKASAEMFAAIQEFNASNWEVALNGDDNNAGFLEIIDNYGSTPQASLAAHYAGISYLKLGDAENALTYLKKYDTAKGATAEIINAQNYGLQADILVDKGEFAAAAKLYKKAIEASDNIMTAPTYLKKLGLVEEELGNKEAAKKAYTTIAEKYNTSLEARDIDLFIGRLR